MTSIKLIMVITLTLLHKNAFAGCAGCGADYNKADRAATARQAEIQRLERVDPPVRPDPVGNALIGGGVSGVMRGSVGAAAGAFGRGAAIGTAAESAKQGGGNK